MKNLFFAFFLFIPSLSIAFQNEPDGFRDIKWGTDLSDIPSLILTSADDNGVRSYLKKDEKLKIGDAQITLIIYKAWRYKFFRVHIMGNGKKDFRLLMEKCLARFGDPSTIGKEKFLWEGEKSKIEFIFIPQKETFSLNIISKNLWDEYLKELLDKKEESQRKKADEDF